MDLKDRVRKLVDKRRRQLEKELEEYEEKMSNTMSTYYCYSGTYRRQEAARDKRKEQLDELDDFEKQLKSAIKHIKTNVYAFRCQNCGAVIMTTLKPCEGWHECPTCRHMVRLPVLPKRTIRIAEDGGAWQEMLKEAKKGDTERNETD